MSVPTGGQESCSTDDDRTGRQKVNDDHYKIGYFVGSLSSTCIKRVLSEALIRPVRWRETFLALLDAGAEDFVETGPGTVLSKMARRITKETANA